MADKDLLEVIAEMLHKQDRQSELIVQTNTRITETNSILKEFMGINKEFMGISKDFMDISKDFMGLNIKQWDEQLKFNERLYDKVDSIEKQIFKFVDLEDRVKRIENIVFKGS